mmetsp:Transcript_35561/g.34595  ORF Transcript_35561/g.34595 Transcript_35561/m.34595 type:complete len:282 (-) Transcript_35561:766-1611(-)
MAHPRGILLQPLFLKDVGVDVAGGGEEVGDEGDESRGEAAFGQEVHFDFLHDDELVIDGGEVQRFVVEDLAFWFDELHADLDVVFGFVGEVLVVVVDELLELEGGEDVDVVFLFGGLGVLVGEEDAGLRLVGVSALQVPLVQGAPGQVREVPFLLLQVGLHVGAGVGRLEDHGVGGEGAVVLVEELVAEVPQGLEVHVARDDDVPHLRVLVGRPPVLRLHVHQPQQLTRLLWNQHDRYDHYHYDEHLPWRRVRIDIAVADGGESDDGEVEGVIDRQPGVGA